MFTLLNKLVDEDEEEVDSCERIKCKCRQYFSTDTSNSENSAILKHGSVLSIGCLNFLFIRLDFIPSETKLTNSSSKYEYEESSLLIEKKNRENELIKLKWKNKEKSLSNKKDLLSMCSSKLNFKLKNENKRTLFD